MERRTMVGRATLGVLGLGWMALAWGCGDDAPPGGEVSGTTTSSMASTTLVSLDSSSTRGTPESSDTLEPTTGTTEGDTATAGTAGTAGTASTTGAGSGTGTEGMLPSGRVLFLGNSYTQWNGMTAMVEALAAEQGSTLEVMAITQGGATVADLLARRDVQVMVAEPGWDFVVIQGQSYEPLVQPMVFEDAAVELAGLAAAAGAEPVFFETWARAPGHELYDEVWSGGDPVGMQALLHAAYGAAAEASGGTLAPVGSGWALCLEGSPAIVLHGPDGSHPTVEGSYLAAAVFLGIVWSEPVGDNGWWPEPMSEPDAAALRGCADAAVEAER